jgi:hypothetical protein
MYAAREVKMCQTQHFFKGLKSRRSFYMAAQGGRAWTLGAGPQDLLPDTFQIEIAQPE